MAEGEVGKLLTVVRASDDDGVDLRSCVKELNRPLQDWSSAEVLVELGARRTEQVIGVVVACGRARGREYQGDLHA